MPIRRFFFEARAAGLPLRLLVIFSLFLPAAQARSQEGRQEQKADEDVLTLKARLVNIDVMVKDRKGKYITDLRPEDFEIFENGVRQRVEFFDPPLSLGGTAGQPEGAPPAASGLPGGKPLNIISLVIDGQTTELANLKHVREGTIKYIRERVADTDTVAVFAVTNGLRLLQTFTHDKAKLISAVENAYSASTASKNLEQSDIAKGIEENREEIRGLEGSTAPGDMVRAQLARRALEQFLKLRSQLSVQQARPILAALAAICEAQRTISGKKTLVMFSQGFVASSALEWQVQSMIDIANRANVSIYIIDSAGLKGGGTKSGSYVPESPLGGVSASASAESRIRTVGGENVFDHVQHEGLDREQDILFRIAGDSGGKFIKGTNDIAKGLNQIDEEVRARYTLAYYSTDQNYDGSFRKLKVEARRPGANVISRSGFFAVASDDAVPLSHADRKLLAGFAAAAGNPALPLFVELSPFRSTEGNYIVPLSIELPPDSVKFDRKGDRQRMQIEVLGLIRQTEDKIISRLGGIFDVALGAEEYASILNNKIFYRQDMELPPGSYSIDLIVKDRLSGKTSARREKLDLPPASGEFSTSGVVLSRLAMQAAAKPGAAPSGDVFTQGGVQIRPSPSREFRDSDNLIIFFESYNAAKTGTGQPLVMVTVTLMKEGKAVIKPIDYSLSEVINEPTPHLTFAKYISLKGLQAGEYSALIQVRDMVTRKVVTQQVPFAITQ